MKLFSGLFLAIVWFPPTAFSFVFQSTRDQKTYGLHLPLARLSLSASLLTKRTEVTSDSHVLSILEKINVKPPWKKEAIISTQTFNFVLRNILSSGDKLPDSAERAQEILNYMIHSDREEIEPDLVSLNTVLAIYSKKTSPRHRQHANRADEIRKEWGDLYRRGVVSSDTDRISANTVLSAFVRAGSIDKARDIFDALQSQYEETENQDMKPDVVSYSTMLRGYASQGRARDAESLFQSMKEEGPHPTVECFNEVLLAYAKSNLPGRAEDFLKVWSEDTEEPVRPNVRSYNAVLHALSNNQDPSSILRAERLLNRIPARDATSYTTFIHLCCHLPGHMALDATNRALQKASRDSDIAMDPAFIANVLYSLSSCDDRDMPSYSESLVEKLIESRQKPTVQVYNALLHCWAKSGDRQAGRRSIEILSTMHGYPYLQPDIKTYTNVLDCLAKCRDPESVVDADDIVSTMEKDGPYPTTQTYTTLIRNFAYSRLPFKASKAAEILQRMKESGRSNAQPTIVTYNAVLNAAEYTDGSDLQVREEALKVACIAFDEIRNSTMKANHVTYGSVLGVLTNLMTAEMRQEIVSLVFKRCILDGQVSFLVLKKLKTAVVSVEQYKALLEGHNENRLPESWTCNVEEARAREIL